MKTPALLFLVVGLGLTCMNWACLFGSWVRKRYISPVFPAPSVLTALGLALLDRTRSFWWIGLLTDYTLFVLLVVAPRLAADAWRTSRFTRVQRFRAEDGPGRFELSLHRGARFLLRVTFDPSMPCGGQGAHVSGFGLVGGWQEMQDGRLHFRADRQERVFVLEKRDAGFVGCEERGPEGAGFLPGVLDGVEFRLVV